MAEAGAIAGILEIFFTTKWFTQHLASMAVDGSHLSQRVKWIIAQELSGLVERALN